MIRNPNRGNTHAKLLCKHNPGSVPAKNKPLLLNKKKDIPRQLLIVFGITFKAELQGKMLKTQMKYICCNCYLPKKCISVLFKS